MPDSLSPWLACAYLLELSVFLSLSSPLSCKGSSVACWWSSLEATIVQWNSFFKRSPQSVYEIFWLRQMCYRSSPGNLAVCWISWSLPSRCRQTILPALQWPAPDGFCHVDVLWQRNGFEHDLVSNASSDQRSFSSLCSGSMITGKGDICTVSWSSGSLRSVVDPNELVDVINRFGSRSRIGLRSDQDDE